MQPKTTITVSLVALVVIAALSVVTDASGKSPMTQATTSCSEPALEKTISSKYQDTKVLYESVMEQRNRLASSLLLVVQELRFNKEEMWAGSRLDYAIRELGDIRAGEAVGELLSIIDVRFPPRLINYLLDPEDPEVIQALAKIGKPASIKALTYICLDNSPKRAKMYVRVIALVEGVELGKEMVRQAAQKEKDPQYRERLEAAVELFKDADKIVDLPPPTLEWHKEAIYCLALCPDGKTLASAGEDKTIKLWDMTTRLSTATLEGHGDGVGAMAFSPNGQMLASRSADKTIRLWDVAKRKTIAILEGHGDTVMAVAFSQDGKTLASGSDDGTMKLWDVATRKNTATSEKTGFVSSVAFSRDGKTLAYGVGGGTIKLWNIETGKSTTICDDDREYVAPIVLFSPDGKTLATAAHCNNRGGVLLWDVATGKNTATLKGHGAWGVVTLGYTPDGKTLISVGGHDTEIMFWGAATGNHIGTLDEQTRQWRGYDCAALSSDGKTLVVGTTDKRMQVLQLKIPTAATQPATQPVVAP